MRWDELNFVCVRSVLRANSSRLEVRVVQIDGDNYRVRYEESRKKVWYRADEIKNMFELIKI
jgi:hypothetical protein